MEDYEFHHEAGQGQGEGEAGGGEGGGGGHGHRVRGTRHQLLGLLAWGQQRLGSSSTRKLSFSGPFVCIFLYIKSLIYSIFNILSAVNPCWRL